MVAILHLISLVALSSLASALPTPLPNLKFPPIVPKGLVCRLPIVQRLLCPRTTTTGLIVNTPIGTAHGSVDTSAANRFAVKYAAAPRWQNPSPVTAWVLPNNATDVTALPLACPQPGLDDSSFSEDCLSMILYVPNNLPTTPVPTLMWIHGGSFIVGSATGPGLDGSNLAVATNSIVAVVQYRLGALGWMQPNGGTNLAMKDLMAAMSFLKVVVPSFGGDPSKVTIAGQSSGANMIRALLAIPSASSLFQNAIIQSDPMDYGFLNPGAQQTMQNYFNGLLTCSKSDTRCLNSLSLDTIINAQMNLFENAYTLDPSATQAEPMRPVRDGQLITTTLDSSSPFPHVSKPILVSTVLNEAALTIYGNFDTLPEAAFYPVVNATFGSPRTNVIVNSAFYNDANLLAEGVTIDARTQLETLGTDYIWKCSSWTFARNWASNGGQAFVGMYVVGASYPGNDAVDFCTQPGSVCHQDDIEIVFGTVPSPTTAQASLTTEMQARYASFMRTGNPNPSGSSLAHWGAAGTSNVNAILLGGSGMVPINACSPSYWGQQVLYDYQTFGI
ncbi:hypothetical protein JAAARDRAFT_32121 [Jaapia argillacea MUCL 33604]|uniref:Carboxylic ester hydrolase n=1 Tax=Jaapia argillacea MUCL 33604 TaxID=933084 RepID=A0A067QC90_9AGAM|nr:hypothetical protein JAAARDRAFT_32121 [Jaapia argillacea MUCL 33604]